MMFLRFFIHQDAELQQKLCRKTVVLLKYRHTAARLNPLSLERAGQDYKSVNVFFIAASSALLRTFIFVIFSFKRGGLGI